MKKLLKQKMLLFVSFIFFTTAVIAQEDDAVEEEMTQVAIDMKFNKSLYPMNEGNMFYSDTPKAVIMAMEVPQKYSEMKAELDSESQPEDLKNTKKGEFEEAGTKVIYFTGIMTDDTGKEIFMEILVKKATEDTCIMITSMYELSAKEKFSKEARKAILSAKIVQ